MLARLIAFVVPLGFDTLAVALALGLRGTAPLVPALVFAAFEAIMPLAGIAAGRLTGARFATPAAIAGGLVLVAVGIHALREARDDDDDTQGLTFGTLRAAAAAGFGISLDEFAVGFPMGTAHLPLAALLSAIALQAFVVTVAGIALGRAVAVPLGRRARRWAGSAAGAAFTALGVWLAVEPFLRR